jgi:hypothetical protein
MLCPPEMIDVGILALIIVAVKAGSAPSIYVL